MLEQVDVDYIFALSIALDLIFFEKNSFKILAGSKKMPTFASQTRKWPLK